MDLVDVAVCSICYHELLNNLVSLQCGHVFHRECIQNFENYSHSQRVCANCRGCYQYKIDLKFQIEKHSENLEEKTSLVELNTKLKEQKDENKKLIQFINKQTKLQKDKNKKDYRLHSKYMMMYMTKMSLKDENIRLVKKIQGYSSTYREYANRVFKYDEELNSIKDKLAVSDTVERIKNNLLDIKEIEHFVNFSDIDKHSLEDQNKFYLEIIHSLLGKLNENQIINKKDKSFTQKLVKNFNKIEDLEAPVIDLSLDKDKIDLIEEESNCKSNFSIFNYLSKSSSSSLISKNSFYLDLVDISDNSDMVSNKNSFTIIDVDNKKQGSSLRDFSEFNHNLKKTKQNLNNNPFDLSQKEIYYLGKKIERNNEKSSSLQKNNMIYPK